MFLLLTFMCISVSPECASVQHARAGALEVRRGHHIPVTGVTDPCEMPCGCWGLSLGLLRKQPVLLCAGPSLQPQD